MQLQQDILFDNRYLLKKLLGRGGFSEVWLVEDIKVGNKKMALKVYVPDTGLDSDGVLLFSSEFELVFDLNNSHLLRPAHFNVCNRSPYLLMAYCEQGSANNLIGCVTENDAWRFLHDVATGLAYLHAQNPPIIHQDIKPANILKDNNGNYQITDFGISTKARSTLRKSLETTEFGGTMAYMPPERFGKEHVPIKASDIWSMGATVFELLAGDVPFGEHGGLKQKNGAEIPNIPGKWSKELMDIVTLCLQKKTWDRPVAQQIVEWTDIHLKGQKISFKSKKKRYIITQQTPGSLLRVLGWVIAGCVLVFAFVKYVTPQKATDLADPKPEQEQIVFMDEDKDWNRAEEENTLQAYEHYLSQYSSGKYADEAKQRIQNSKDAEQAEQAWIAEYDRLINTAKSAFNNRNYTAAKVEYNKALNLAIQNRDNLKQTEISRQINACDEAIRQDEETKNRAIQQQLASYNFVGTFKLGTNYMVVQQKEGDKRWGIIDNEGNVAEIFNYDQVSERLTNGFFALKNDRGWTVFDASLNKEASGLENLNEYFKK